MPSDTIATRAGPFMAAGDAFSIRDRAPEPRLAPWNGIDPIVAAADIIPLHRPVSRRDLTRAPVVLSFGAIHGGIRMNIIPARSN